MSPNGHMHVTSCGSGVVRHTTEVAGEVEAGSPALLADREEWVRRAKG